MRNVRVRRQSFIDLSRITIGDWIVLFASLLAFISLFLPWFGVTTPRPHDEWAFTYSEIASVVVIVFFLGTLFLVLYPSLADRLRLAPLPFATPLVFFTMGAILLLVFTYELGKYACVLCQGVSRGYGVWIALVSATVYLVGAVIKWGSRPAQRAA